MSIAIDEAAEFARNRYVGKVHIERHDGRAEIVQDHPMHGICRREGYIAGRTAEPTEAEIEAGALAIFKTLTTSAHPMSDADYADAWNCIAPMQKDQFKRQAQAVLEAARKAVTE